MPAQADISAYQLLHPYIKTLAGAANGELPLPQMDGTSNQRGFDELMTAYKNAGGTARADDLALLMAEKGRGSFVSLAKHIAKGEVFSMEWNNHLWVPMFQFEPRDMSIKLSVRTILRELRHVLDNWDLAAWFIEPNSWLKNRRPLDMLDSDFPEVFAAARADRFVATG